MKQPAQFDYVAMLTDINNPDNERAIADNLAVVHRILSSEQYQKTIQLYWKQAINHSLARLLSKHCPGNETDYGRGFIAALQVVYGLPAAVAEQVAAGEKSTAPAPKGDAGY